MQGFRLFCLLAVLKYITILDATLNILGDYLITKQTTAEGRICNSVMITERKYTRKEYYLAFMNERAFSVSQVLYISYLF